MYYDTSPGFFPNLYWIHNIFVNTNIEDKLLETASHQIVASVVFKAQSLHSTARFIHWNTANFPGREQSVQTLFISSSEVRNLKKASF